MITLDTTNMCSHLQKKLFEDDGIYHHLWMAMQDDPELTAMVRSRQLHIYRNGKKVLILSGKSAPKIIREDRICEMLYEKQINMKQPPIIGVTSLWDSERESLWMLPDYLEGIKAAGGIPVVLPLEMEEDDADHIIEACDGFLFTGGQDVASCPERDNPETLLLSKALQADKPILGICRGLQFINVFLGGTLWKDLPSEHPSEIVHRQGKPYGNPTHKVTLSGELKALLDKDILEVNTLHHQAIKDLANGLKPMAVAPDGIIEAVRMENKRFVWAVQWHPEYMFKKDKNSLALFSHFINFAKRKTC